MRFGLLLAGLMALTGLAGVPAQAADALTGYKADQITALLTALGATEMKQTTVDGDPRLTFKYGEIIYVADFYTCDDTANGCKLLQFACAFDSEATDTVEAVNNYNATYVFGKASLSKADGLMSYRAMIWAPGVSKELVLAEFESFRGSTASLLAHMKNNVVASRDGLPFVDTTAFAKAASVSPKRRPVPRSRR
jgi:hypothetical protein